LYLLLSVPVLRLSDPWSLITYAAFVPMVPVQQAAQRINDRKLGVATEDRNHRYNRGNIATIIVGGLLKALAVVNTFIPE